LRLGKVQKKRVAVIEFRVYERCGDSVRSGVVKNVPHSTEEVGVMMALDGMRRLGSEILGR